MYCYVQPFRSQAAPSRGCFFEQGVSRASRARSRSCASGSRPRTFLYPVGPPLSEERCVGRRVGVWHDPLWFQFLTAPPMVRKILNQLLSCRNPLVPPGPTGLLVPEGRPVWFNLFTKLFIADPRLSIEDLDVVPGLHRKKVFSVVFGQCYGCREWIGSAR